MTGIHRRAAWRGAEDAQRPATVRRPHPRGPMETPTMRLARPASLLIALLGFVTTAALAKFLMRGEVIE